METNIRKSDIHNKLRYVISVDFECMIDSGMSFKEAEDWFNSEDCIQEYEEEWTHEEIHEMFEKCRSYFEYYYKLSTHNC